MNIKCCAFSSMAAEIKKSDQKIMLFGAGAIGTVTVPEILKDNGLLQYVICYLDNDCEKWGKEINISDKTVKVSSPQYIRKYTTQIAVLLNISRYAEALEQLEALEKWQGMLTCYIMPLMCIYNFNNDKWSGAVKDFSRKLIPKQIHYMWFGGKRLPQNLQKCVNSWKEFCPDYEIIRWDETNYDVSKNLYMKQAYQNGAYGFIPDYARLDILYNYGGIYLDTDVELIRPLDELLYQEAFCGVEKWQILNFGGCSGAVKGQQALKKLLDYREKISFIDENGMINKNTCGFYDTRVILDNGYKINGYNQKILGMNIYSYDYFHPYDYMTGQMFITENTFSIHHFNGGWLDEKLRQMNQKTAESFKEICKRIVFGDMESDNEN
ncbi:hypothetical protein NSB25_00300 [Acetatifactor muris]|uniref:Subversion of eukaryotic traffic protein A n=1 Tax=Acetatifactor muris TaxID=879566 RepID=A0A2K4ZG72_9FIRM|nr:glycosyltransferase [Acetatifactor muris]MCR2045727.1 hypothetical protein [Acetatifactor muris]SOY29465.1 Subversion of eukaryotic traffic protein A [Acetatifactor muris]